MGAILLQNVGEQLGVNQYSHRVDAEVKVYEYKFSSLFFKVF